MAPVFLPYFVEAAALPAKLPTIDEIENSRDILCEQSARKVVGVGQHFVVKYGLAVDLMEGQNMVFIQKATSVPVPRIYALFRNPTSNKNYIIMERVAGQRLDTEWRTLSQGQKDAITIKLRGYFDEIRRLPTPGGYCSVNNQALLDNVFWTGDTADAIAGPFTTEEELNDAMIKKYIFNNLPKNKADFYKRAFPSILRNHHPVFTHGDLQRKNILVQETSPSPDLSVPSTTDYNHEVTVIDWEIAGWYPSYWEYARSIFACGRWNDDWSVYVDKVLDPFLNEWAWMDMLLKELWS